MTGRAEVDPAGRSAEEEPSVTSLEEQLDYHYSDRGLLETALTHASFAHEQGGKSNERLEFLGDSVIGLVGAHLLYEAHPSWPEGDLTRALHQLVDGRGLARLARELDVGPHLRLGRTERRSNGAQKSSILANAIEAILGAMYLDGGLAPVEALARRRFALALAPDAPRVGLDPKTRFQEWVMAESGTFPLYRVVGDSNVEGDEQRFTVEVCVEGRGWAKGWGRSKRGAEQEAAAMAYEYREEFLQEALDASSGAGDLDG